MIGPVGDQDRRGGAALPVGKLGEGLVAEVERVKGLPEHDGPILRREKVAVPGEGRAGHFGLDIDAHVGQVFVEKGVIPVRVGRVGLGLVKAPVGR